MKLFVILSFTLVARQIVNADVSHLSNNQYLPPTPPNERHSDDFAVNHFQPPTHQQHPQKSFLHNGVEIIRSIPIASYTLTTIVPVQETHAPSIAGTNNFQVPQSSYQAPQNNYQTHPQYQPQSQPVYRTAPQLAGQQNDGFYAYDAPAPAPVMQGFAALGPAISPTYSTDSQQRYSALSAPQTKATYAQNIDTFNYAVPAAAPKVVPIVSARPPYSGGAHQSGSYNFAPVGPAQQRFSASAAPSNEYLPPASTYSPQAYSTPAAPAQQTHNTPAPVALSYSVPSQQSYAAPGSTPLQDNYSVSTPHTANNYLPPASAPVPQAYTAPAQTPFQFPAAAPQVSTQTFHAATESENYNAPVEQSYSAPAPHVSHEYLPPTSAPLAQTFSINQQAGSSDSLNEQEESQSGSAILSQPVVTSTLGNEGDSAPVEQPAQALEQQSHTEQQQSDENSDSGNYETAVPTEQNSATHAPAQQTYPTPASTLVALPLQQSYSSPRQQSYSTPAQQTYIGPAPPSQQSHFSSTPVAQEYSSASQSPAAPHHSALAQHSQTASASAPEVLSAPPSASVSQEYLPPAPQKQPYARPAEEPINHYSNSAPVTISSPGAVPVESSYRTPVQALVIQQPNSLVSTNQQPCAAPSLAPLPAPVQISQEYLSPTSVKQSQPKPALSTVSRQSYSAPASAPASSFASPTLSYSTPHAQTFTVNHNYFPQAQAAQSYMAPSPAPTPAPIQRISQTSAATLSQTSSDYQSANNGQAQLIPHLIAAPQKYSSAPAPAAHTNNNFQSSFAASAAEVSNQGTGTIYGSNGGYIYRKYK